MTIIGIARPIGQPALSQDDTLAGISRPAPAVPVTTCDVPWCVVHVDPSVDAGLDPGVAWHQGAQHVVTGTAADVNSPIELRVERFDLPDRVEQACVVVTARHDVSSLTAAELRELAAAALAVAAQVDPDGVPAALDTRQLAALSASDAGLAGYAEALRHIASQAEADPVDPAGLRGTADLIERVLAGPFGAGQPGGAA